MLSIDSVINVLGKDFTVIRRAEKILQYRDK